MTSIYTLDWIPAVIVCFLAAMCFFIIALILQNKKIREIEHAESKQHQDKHLAVLAGRRL